MKITEQKLKDMAEEAGFILTENGTIFLLAKLADLVSANSITSMQTELDEIKNGIDFKPDSFHEIPDMANVGYSLMKYLKIYQTAYCWNESPAEIVGELTEQVAYLKKALTLQSLEHPVAQAYINTDGECEQIDWLGTIDPKVDEEFTPLYTHPAPVTSMQGDSDYSLVRNDVLAFLHGEEELDGMGFGDAVEAIKGSRIGKYWWRKYLREATKPVVDDRVKGVSDDKAEFEKWYGEKFYKGADAESLKQYFAMRGDDTYVSVPIDWAYCGWQARSHLSTNADSKAESIYEETKVAMGFVNAPPFNELADETKQIYRDKASTNTDTTRLKRKVNQLIGLAKSCVGYLRNHDDALADKVLNDIPDIELNDNNTDGWVKLPIKLNSAITDVYDNNYSVYQSAEEMHQALINAISQDKGESV